MICHNLQGGKGMFVLKIIKNIILFPVWLILAILTLIVSMFVNVLGFARAVSAGFLGLLLFGVLYCYHDFVQAAFLIVLIAIGYLLLFAGVAVQVVLESMRDSILR